MGDSDSAVGGSGVERAHRILRAIRVVPDSAARAALLAELTQAAPDGPTKIVSFVNAHGLNLAWSDPAIARNLAGSDVLLRDGIGISLLMRLLGLERGINMNGTDFIPLLLKTFAGKRVALCGTAEPYLAQAAEAVRRQGATVVLAMDGFQDIAAYPPAIAAAGAELVILGMGMPKQEAAAFAIAAPAQAAASTLVIGAETPLAGNRGPALIVNGGAILDFWAGRFPRAPLWVQTLRLEWLFRLVQEPRRLWRRYLLGGLVFAWRAACLRCLRPIPGSKARQ